MDLDGLLGRAELSRDLLVQHPGRDQLQHLALARGKAREAAHDILALAMLRAPGCIPQQRLAYGGHELGALHRLREEGDRAGFHRLHGRRNVALPGDEDDGPVDAAFKAIEAATGITVALRKFEVQAVSEGQDAQGEARVYVEYNRKSYRGASVSTNIVESGTRAFLEVINRIELAQAGTRTREERGAATSA